MPVKPPASKKAVTAKQAPRTAKAAPASKWRAAPVGQETRPQPEPARAGGRPTEFKEVYIEQARKLAMLGATDIEIADFFEVSVRTIHRWKASNEAFCHSLKAGKSEADDRVERSLFARANGYEHDEVDIRVISGRLVQTPIRKYYAPDTTAAIFWLKNRRPDLWREKVEAVHTGPGGGPLQARIAVEFVKPTPPKEGGTE